MEEEISLRRAHVAIDNTIKVPEILEMVAEYGYSLEHMEAGLALYESAKAAVNARTIAVGAQTGGRKHLWTTEKVAFRTYQKAAEIARAVYRGNEDLLSSNFSTNPLLIERVDPLLTFLSCDSR